MKSPDRIQKALQVIDFTQLLERKVNELRHKTRLTYLRLITVCVVPFGKWDVRKAVEGGRREEWLKYIDYILGSLFAEQKANSERLGHPVTQSAIIMDFDGFGMRQLTSLSSKFSS